MARRAGSAGQKSRRSRRSSPVESGGSAVRRTEGSTVHREPDRRVRGDTAGAATRPGCPGARGAQRREGARKPAPRPGRQGQSWHARTAEQTARQQPRGKWTKARGARGRQPGASRARRGREPDGSRDKQPPSGAGKGAKAARASRVVATSGRSPPTPGGGGVPARVQWGLPSPARGRSVRVGPRGIVPLSCACGGCLTHSRTPTSARWGSHQAGGAWPREGRRRVGAPPDQAGRGRGQGGRQQTETGTPRPHATPVRGGARR